MENLGIIAIAGIIIAAWKQIFAFVKNSLNYIVGCHELDRKSLISLLRYCHDDLKEFKFRSRRLYQINAYITDENNNTKIAPTIVDLKLCGINIYFDKWKPLIINSSYGYEGKIYTLRFIWNLKTLFHKVAEHENKFKNSSYLENNRFFVRRICGKSSKIDISTVKNEENNDKKSIRDYSIFELGDICLNEKVGECIAHSNQKVSSITSNKRDPLSVFTFNNDVNSFMSRLMKWMSLRDWYESVGLSHTRGILLHGKAGTGKSTIAKAIGYKTNRPVYIFDLASMDNSELINFWQSYSTDEAIFLFEDIDTIFQGRKNITANESKISFDCFINLINGAGNNHGLIIVITTNNIDVLDEALIRSGRLDEKIYFGEMSEEAKIEHLGKLLPNLDHRQKECILSNSEEMVAAEFNELCLQHVLKSNNE